MAPDRHLDPLAGPPARCRIKILAQHRQGLAWHRRAGLCAKGSLFDAAGTFHRGAQLLYYFASVAGADDLRDKLRAAKGCFAVILDTERQLLAVVDSVRSIPLFYACQAGGVVVGDDVYAIQQKLGGAAEIDPVAREEFLRVGYPVGPRTLDPRVGQIEAGEFYVWDKAAGRGRVQAYFRHAHGSDTGKSEAELLDELDEVTSRWARRLIASVEGRTMAIALSGGYDSRYVACALKREGCANVVCYSYGSPDSYEWQVARQVAARLGYPIHIVDYGRKAWRATLGAPWFVEFMRLAAQRCAIPCIQELPACAQLQAGQAIPADAVMVPGYGGDLQAGNYLPAEILAGRSEALLAEGIDRYLYRRLFTLVSAPIAPETKRAILGRIHDDTARFKSDDLPGFCSVYEDWWVRHRSARFIVNTVRTFEWFGHEWRLPLWDNELLEWWQRIPL